MSLHLGHRARLAIRYGGIAVFGFVCFVFAVQLTFPYNRVRQKAVDMLADKYDVTIGDVERGILPGRFYLKSVTLRTRPQKADDVPTTFFIDKLEVDAHILSSILKWGPVVSFDAKIGAGHLSGAIAANKSDFSMQIDGEDLPSASLPMREILGLPMSGKVAFDLDLDRPIEPAKNDKTGKTGVDWSKAEGEVNFSCPSGCTIGDGKTKLKTKMKNARNAAFAADGIEFGKVDIDSLVAKVEIKNGKVDVTKFDTKSTDGELHVDYSMKLEPNLDDSTVTGCLRYKGSESLSKKEPKTFSAIQLIGGALGPDGLYHVKLADKFREIRKLSAVCGPGAGPETPTEVPTARPNLVVHPDEPKPPPPQMPPPPPPPVNPPPPPPTGAGAVGSAAGSGSSATVPPPAEGSAAGSGSEAGSGQVQLQ